MNEQETIDKAIAYGNTMSEAEMRSLWSLSQNYIPQNGLAVEVGTWKGGSAVILGEVCRQKQARLICIDLFNWDMHGKMDYLGVSPSMIFRTTRKLSGLPINYITGKSQDIVNILADNIADFIFIDGSHYLPVVKIDIEGFWDKLKPGGFYCGHDYFEGKFDVKSVVDNFFGKEKIKLIDTIWCISKNNNL